MGVQVQYLLSGQFSTGCLSLPQEQGTAVQHSTAQDHAGSFVGTCVLDVCRKAQNQMKAYMCFRGLALLSKVGCSSFTGEMFGCQLFQVHKAQRTLVWGVVFFAWLGFLLGFFLCVLFGFCLCFFFKQNLSYVLSEILMLIQCLFNQTVLDVIFLSAGTGLCSDFCPNQLQRMPSLQQQQKCNFFVRICFNRACPL